MDGEDVRQRPHRHRRDENKLNVAVWRLEEETEWKLLCRELLSQSVCADAATLSESITQTESTSSRSKIKL